MASQYVLKDGSVQWMADQLVYIQGRQIRRRKKGFPTKGEAETYEQTLSRTTSKGRSDPEVDEILIREERKREARDRPSLQAVFHQFVLMQENNGKKFNTIKHYRQSFGQLKTIVPDSFWHMTPTDIQRVVAADLHKKQKNRIKILLLLYKFARERFSDVPVLDIPIKYDYTQPDVYMMQDEEFQRVVEAEPNLYYKHLWTVLSLTGLRIGEALALEWPDVVNGTLRVNKTTIGYSTMTGPTKTYAIRYIPLHPMTLKCLEFFRENNNPGQPRIVDRNRRAVYEKLSRLCKANGLSSRITCHSFRHYFASKLLQTGADVVTVKTLMGHASILMTSRYLHLLDNSPQKAVLSLPCHSILQG